MPSERSCLMKYKRLIETLTEGQKRRLRAWAVGPLTERREPRLILDERLRVPKYLLSDPESILPDFEYEIQVRGEPERVEQDDGSYKLVEVVETAIVTSYRETKTHYLFSRGDYAKLEEHFGHIPWVDKRSAVPSPARVRLLSDLKPTAQVRAAACRPNPNGPVITLRPDQARVLEQWLQFGGGIFLADTGWGKTASSISLLCSLGLKTLLLVEEVTCGQNWIEEFRTHTDICYQEQKLGRELIGFYGKTGKKGRFWPFVTVATYQSFLRNTTLKLARNDFGCLWVDEVDRVGAEGYSRVSNVVNSVVRGGCTATFSRNDGLEGLVSDIVGPVVAHGREKMMHAHIRFVFTGVKVPDYRNNYWWTNALSYIVGSEKKPGDEAYFDVVLNQVVRDVIEGRWVVVVSERNGFLKRLEKALVETEQTDLLSRKDAVRLLIGESQRDQVVHLAKTGVTRVTLAQAKLIRRAINVKPWNSLHLCTPMAGWSRATKNAPPDRREPNAELKQVVGRVRRRMSSAEWQEFAQRAGLSGKDKPTPIVYDYVTAESPDMNEYANQHKGRFFSMTYRSRQGAYEKMGFDVLSPILVREVEQQKRRRGLFS